MFTPSTLNCTQATPTLSEAVAERVTVPLNACPAVGVCIETVGGTVSLERRVSKTEEELPLNVAVRVADCDDLKTATVAEKVAVEAPVATVTEDGADSEFELVSVMLTAIPPDGAG